MKLPNGDRAELGAKLEEYVLNPAHRDGRHKARAFESTLGITLTNPGILRQAILTAAATADDALSRGDNGYGVEYTLQIPVQTAKGTATVLTAWIVRHEEDFPRLTTCYIV
jgi:hypothetical protein